MDKKKVLIGAVLGAVILAVCGFFLLPRSLTGEVGQVQSISVVVIESNMDPATAAYVYNGQDPEFGEIMDTLDDYSYHLCPGTISSRIENSAALEGNEAGYWLYVHLYSEPDRDGDCYSIVSGGTGEILAGDVVYRVGYFGNDTVIKMMNEICQIVTP